MQKNLKILLFLSLFIFTSCSLRPEASSATNRYVLTTPLIKNNATKYSKTLKIAIPKGANFLFTDNIAYVENGTYFGFYQHNKWEETPAKQLQLLFSNIIRQSTLFENVIISPTQIQNNLLLESRVDAFTYNFDANRSYVKVAINLFLVDKAEKIVLKNNYFEVVENVPRNSPKSVIKGFNKAINKLSNQIISWL